VNAAEKWVVPPGYRLLADVVQEYGRDHAQTNLMSGQWPAVKFDLKTGDLAPIPATTWCAARGRKWLEKGEEGESVGLKPAAGNQLGIDRYALIVRVSERRPPWTDNPKDAYGPKVRLANELMDATFPQGEWRQMGVRAVRKRCEQQAKTGGVQLPSPDSFSRAMGRRRK
jgi:hypothetical protein